MKLNALWLKFFATHMIHWSRCVLSRMLFVVLYLHICECAICECCSFAFTRVIHLTLLKRYVCKFNCTSTSTHNIQLAVLFSIQFTSLGLNPRENERVNSSISNNSVVQRVSLYVYAVMFRYIWSGNKLFAIWPRQNVSDLTSCYYL